MSASRAVLSAVGPDRPGIVDRLSALIHEAGGNIEDSRMAILGGDFALVLLFAGPPAALARVRRCLGPLARRLKLSCSLKPTRPRRGPERRRLLRLDVRGLDHPGIVHHVTAVLAAQGVNVAALDTRLAEAPESGAPFFILKADLQAPRDLSLSDLRRSLDRVCASDALDFSIEELVSVQAPVHVPR
jgi:glycine cleavage system transcriptional repressor